VTPNPPANSFNALRLLAATLVIFAHGYELSGRSEPLATHVTGGTTAGAVGVYMFFSMSGWLVTQSFASDPHLGRFLARRLLRILPAFVVTLLAMVLLLGPVVTVLALPEYFSDRGTHRYFGGLLVFPLQHTLPGVFTRNPLTDSVNGSLWTLAPELFCYLFVATLGSLALLGPRAALVSLVAAAAGAGWLQGSSGPPPVLLYMNVKLLFELMVFFVSGALLWFHRERLVFSWLAVPVLAASLWAFGSMGYGWWIVAAMLPYATLSVALLDTGTARFFDRVGDWSYGTYLWAFPIQQTLIWLYPSLPVVHYIAAAVALAWIFGALSWHLIEKHALRLKPVTRSCAAPQPAR
jgi:peptidoglycan/LPS O-acetylase OafA/YrhL